MDFEQDRLSVDEAAEIIRRQFGLPLTGEGLVEVCESGWEACRFDEQGQWTVDREALSSGDAPRELVDRIERLAAERQDADGVMQEPPAGAEAEEF